jgi:S-layer homology domain
MLSARRALLVTLVLGIGAPLVAQMPPPAESAPPPMTYGTAAVSWVDIPAEDFVATSSSIVYDFANGGIQASNCGGPLCFRAPVHLPSGAKLVSLQLIYNDSSSTKEVIGSLLACDYAGQNCTEHPAAGAGPADCVAPGVICSGVAYDAGVGYWSADLTADDITVQNINTSYRLSGGGTSLDFSTRLQGMKVGYVLQVSPPPASATFNDVPTNHPFFQFIEALHASGITAGCQANPPLYCPDAPLTRGQMAVFLAKALGLQFP